MGFWFGHVTCTGRQSAPYTLVHLFCRQYEWCDVTAAQLYSRGSEAFAVLAKTTGPPGVVKKKVLALSLSKLGPMTWKFPNEDLTFVLYWDLKHASNWAAQYSLLRYHDFRLVALSCRTLAIKATPQQGPIPSFWKNFRRKEALSISNFFLTHLSCPESLYRMLFATTETPQKPPNTRLTRRRREYQSAGVNSRAVSR